MIKIYKNKITNQEYNPKTEELEEIDVSADSLLNYLREEVVLAEGVTPRDLVEHLYPEYKTLDICFHSWNSGHSLKIFYDWMNSHKKSESFTLKQIEMTWRGEIENDGNIIVFADVYGSDAVGTHFGLDLSPISDWKDLPLVLNEKIIYEAQEVQSDGKIKNIVSLRGIKKWTLFDLISEFLYELTWYGNPENQMKIREETGEMIDQQLQFRDYEFEPLPELSKGARLMVMLKEKKSKLQEAVDEENYEAAVKLREEIKLLREEIKNDNSPS